MLPANRKLTVCVTHWKQFALHTEQSALQNHFCGASGEAVIVTEGTGEAAGAALAAGEACGTGVGMASGADCKTERVPVTPGKESIKAISMKLAAAPMVIFAKTLAVPRGPNAVLETLLEKRSPALDLPGCNRMVTTSTTQADMNNPYKM